MSNKVTIDYSTDVGKVRLLIKDDIEDDPLFTDAQIQAFVDFEGSIREAAACACEALAVEFASAGKLNMERGNMVIDRAAASVKYRMMAELFRKVEGEQPYSEYQRLADETLEWRDGITGYHEKDPQDVIGEDD